MLYVKIPKRYRKYLVVARRACSVWHMLFSPFLAIPTVALASKKHPHCTAPPKHPLTKPVRAVALAYSNTLFEGVSLCCMDALTTSSCMLNKPFVSYYNCTITSSTADVCPGWSCSDIGASIGVIADDDYGDSAAAGSGELTGVTSDSLPAATLTPFASTENPVGSGTGVAVSGQRSTSTSMQSVMISFVAVVVGYIATTTLS